MPPSHEAKLAFHSTSNFISYGPLSTAPSGHKSLSPKVSFWSIFPLVAYKETKYSKSACDRGSQSIASKTAAHIIQLPRGGVPPA